MTDLFQMTTRRRIHDIDMAKRTLRRAFRYAPKDRDNDLVAEAYAYVISQSETRPERLNTPFKWVASATTGADDPRYYLRYIKADGKRLIATNGIRIHMARDYRKPGYYIPSNGQFMCHLSEMDYPRLNNLIQQPSALYRIRDVRRRVESTVDDAKTWIRVDIPDADQFPAISVENTELERTMAGFTVDSWVDAVNGRHDRNPFLQFANAEKTAVVIGMDPPVIPSV